MATGTKPTAKPNSSNGKTSFDGRRLLDEITQSAPWELWAEKLSSGKHTQPLHKLVPADCGPPLVWSLRESSSAEAVYLVGELGKLRRKRRADEPADWNGTAGARRRGVHHHRSCAAERGSDGVARRGEAHRPDRAARSGAGGAVLLLSWRGWRA